MNVPRIRARSTMRAGALALAGLLAGCGYAKRTDVENQMGLLRDELRQEMQAGDQALSGRIDDLGARMAALERDLQQLRSEFEVAVERLEGMLAFNVPVHFEFDQAEVREQDREVLDRFAQVVQKYYPTALITVEGFTDPAGSRAYNLKLGKQRAEAVKDYLVSSAGLDPARVRTVSYGEAPDRLVRPRAQGPGAAGMANRRVSLVIDYSAADAVEVTAATGAP